MCVPYRAGRSIARDITSTISNVLNQRVSDRFAIFLICEIDVVTKALSDSA